RRRTGGTHGHTWRPDPGDSLPLASAAARYAARDRRAARRVAADRMDVDEKTRHRHCGTVKPLAPLLIALQFLTRLPVRMRTEADANAVGRSLVYYPLVGLIIGVVLATFSKS